MSKSWFDYASSVRRYDYKDVGMVRKGFMEGNQLWDKKMEALEETAQGETGKLENVS
jgi:hypothetical protein